MGDDTDKAVRILSGETTARFDGRNLFLSNRRLRRPMAKGAVMINPDEQIGLVKFLEEIAAGEHNTPTP